MNDATFVRFFQSLTNFNAIFQYLFCRQRTFHQPEGQRLTFQILHHEIVDTVLMSDVIQCADIRMVKR